jgi:hypothetical protein
MRPGRPLDGESRASSSVIPCALGFARKECVMFAAFPPDFMSETWFIVALIVVGVGLIGLLLFLRSKKGDDD